MHAERASKASQELSQHSRSHNDLELGSVSAACTLCTHCFMTTELC